MIAAGRAWGWYKRYRPAQFQKYKHNTVNMIIRADFIF